MDVFQAKTPTGTEKANYSFPPARWVFLVRGCTRQMSPSSLSPETNPQPPAVKAMRGKDIRALLHLATVPASLKDFILAKQEHIKNYQFGQIFYSRNLETVAHILTGWSLTQIVISSCSKFK